MTKRARNPIETLARQLRSRFLKAHVALDAPQKDDGQWFLDVDVDGHGVVVQWQKDAGFGVSSSPVHGYGEGPDETYSDVEASYGRVVSLVLSRSYTSPPTPVRLQELRRERGFSQVQLAALLGKQQTAVSKLERRHDMLISSVRDVVRSLGGTLRLVVAFPDGTKRQIEFDDESMAEQERDCS